MNHVVSKTYAIEKARQVFQMCKKRLEQKRIEDCVSEVEKIISKLDQMAKERELKEYLFCVTHLKGTNEMEYKGETRVANFGSAVCRFRFKRFELFARTVCLFWINGLRSALSKIYGVQHLVKDACAPQAYTISTEPTTLLKRNRGSVEANYARVFYDMPYLFVKSSVALNFT